MPPRTAPGLCLAAFLCVAFVSLPSAAEAATVLRHATTIDVAADGTLVETVDLALHLDDESDVARWSSFPIALEENRELLDVEARVLEPGGERRKVRRREQDRMETATGVALHSSESFHLVEPEVLRPGETLEIHYRVREEPYFPGGLVALGLADEEVEDLDLRVRVPAGLDGWRWHLDGRTAGLEIHEAGGASHQTLRIRGRLGGDDDPPALAAGTALAPVLRFAWGPTETWQDVGRWYADLLSGVPLAAGPVRALADELLQDVDDADPRAVLEAYVRWVRRQVRYVAVEVGIGGYRPSAPAEVLDRGWGDCKDKSLLLIDLLRQRGIPARAALVRLDHDRRIDPDFPTPYGFNHLIVAVPVESLGPGEPGMDDNTASDEDGLPVAGGQLFVDPTQTLGGAAYLHGAVRGQEALLIFEEERTGRLVPTPPLAGAEANEIELDLETDDLGHAAGSLAWRLEGDAAAGLLVVAENSPTSDLEAHFRGALERLLPGTRLRDLTWSGDKAPLPRFEIRAAIEIRSFLRRGSRGSSVRLPELTRAPEPSETEALESWFLARRLEESLEDAAAATGDSSDGDTLDQDTSDESSSAETVGRKSDEPIGRIEAGRLESILRVRLPEGSCPPREKVRRVENGVGLFSLEIGPLEDGADGFVVQRLTELRRSWIRPADLDDLRELALAEHRAGRRRVRLRCSE